MTAKKPAADVSLSFPGKKSSKEILLGSITSLQAVWCKDSQTKSSLIWSENLSALRALAQDANICGKVNLIYVDPPFASKNIFKNRQGEQAYSDTLVGSAFIEFLRERLILLHHLLSSTGSFYLHLDSKMIFEAKIILDEIFGASNYKSCIVRQKCNSKNYTSKTFGNVVDYILFYTKSSKYTWNRQYDLCSDSQIKEYRTKDTSGRKYMKVPLHAPGARNGETGAQWRGISPPPGKHWQYTPNTLDEMDARGEIYWSSNGNPRKKVFLDERKGTPVQDLWLNFKDANNQNNLITGYPTEKNIDLLHRIIAASSNPGDLVLDAFAGSGTTLVAAHNLKRNWIGIDQQKLSIQTILKRFMTGSYPMGDYVGEIDYSAPTTQSIDNFKLLACSSQLKEAEDLASQYLKQ